MPGALEELRHGSSRSHAIGGVGVADVPGLAPSLRILIEVGPMTTSLPATTGVPYTIEIIPADHGWILETIATAIKTVADRRASEFHVFVVEEPSGLADLVLFLPESAYRPVQHSLVVTYLAHKEDHPGAAKLFEDVARASDACITSARRYKEILERDGARRVFAIPLGGDTRAFKPQLKIGVVGRTYETGRKGEHLLAPAMALPYVDFVFTGAGWPYPSRYFGNADLPSLYSELD